MFVAYSKGKNGPARLNRGRSQDAQNRRQSSFIDLLYPERDDGSVQRFPARRHELGNSARTQLNEEAGFSLQRERRVEFGNERAQFMLREALIFERFYGCNCNQLIAKWRSRKNPDAPAVLNGLDDRRWQSPKVDPTGQAE
jgi:hypothetical protein